MCKKMIYNFKVWRNKNKSYITLLEWQSDSLRRAHEYRSVKSGKLFVFNIRTSTLTLKKSKAQDCPCAYKVLHTADF